MSATQTGFVRSTLLFLLIGTGILIGIIVATLGLVERTRSTFDYILQERSIRRMSADLMQKLTDAETGQRGFVITRDELFLQPYEGATAEIRDDLAQLGEAVKDRPIKAAQMAELRDRVRSKLDEMGQTINLVRSGEPDQAIELVQSDVGRELMDDIREILDRFKELSDANVESGTQDQLAATQQLQWITIGGGIAIIAVMGGALLVVAQHVRALASSRREVEVLNEGLEARVAERTEDLMQANQEIQRFAYIVTHDLRAPLVNIMGFTAELDASLKALQAYVLNDGKAISEEQIHEARLAAAEDLPEAIGFIRSSTKKMDGLINAILKISRDGRRQLKPEIVELQPMLETITASVYHQISESDGNIDLDIKAPRLNTDRLSVEQILGNLFDNAIKYKHPDRPLALAVRTAPEGRLMVRIEVEDNGRGIAEQDHERIFELFRRSGHQDQSGEGIGLAHVRSLARNLGGEITVRSRLGKGSTFVLRLPSDLSRLVRS
ncbi:MULTISPECIES: sensor histidine kinase [Rhizobiaceae]|uniref:histidine kinase n=1 Tax=Peteryoungia algae TaxID=2919917 RepID=A0ABT0CVA6_9HYPH|nr:MULTISPECIES: CHASE3 domain-containing protein [unclassified Rhizobium]MCC8931693.1 CHASE3 domain-containing protein [Rhizobium sp. 'Codium 1']MCJ8237062.1 CHASE3 domain-containing protein [Rhizobium sp. SSM4.3]